MINPTFLLCNQAMPNHIRSSIDKWVWNKGERWFEWRTEETRRQNQSSSTSSTTNLIWSHQELNPKHHVEKSVHNRLSYDTALKYCIMTVNVLRVSASILLMLINGCFPAELEPQHHLSFTQARGHYKVIWMYSSTKRLYLIILVIFSLPFLELRSLTIWSEA